MNEKLLQKTIAVLDFEAVRAELCDCCKLEAGKERLLTLIPSFELAVVRRLCAMTDAARKLLGEKGAPSFAAAKTLPQTIARAEKGAVLTPKELLQVAAMLSSSAAVKSYGGAVEEGSALYDFFFLLNPDRELEEKIRAAIMGEDQIADRASTALYDIRRKLARASAKVRETLQQYLIGSKAAHLQEPIITMRAGRFVIPVKVEHRGDIPGLVHDTSASGATVFVEPMPVVELNNEIKLMENEEQKEVERILAALSADCAQRAHLILTNFESLVQLSVQFAKAEYAGRIEASATALNADGKTKLIAARHPLLDKKSVVPIDLEIGESYDTIVITGPNTGGKTVTLKTIGLFAVMKQCGLQLPAKEGSCIGFYTAILADIGDEQSIEQSLSTFSAHMVNIVSMLNAMEKGALVLFDELGAGTDPLEGAALAIAILQETRTRGALCLATTHYAELKTFALETEGVENASCEFDVRTLSPTYRVMTGIPGRSNAFRIAKRLGVSDAIIGRASALMSGDTLRFEKVVSKLEAERIIMEEKLNEAVKSSEKARSAQEQAQRKAEEIIARAEKDAHRMTAESRRLLETAKQASDSAFDEIRRLQKRSREQQETAQLNEARERLRHTFREAEESMGAIREEAVAQPPERPIVCGDTVLIAGTGKYGVVEKVGKNDLTVRTDGARIKLSSSRVILTEPTQTKPKKTATASVGVSKATIPNEVDLRGMIGEDAWFAADKFIDDARLAGLDSVRLIHGKGTGALRQYIGRMLKGDPRVTEYRLGAYGEGDSGVTVVSLKK